MGNSESASSPPPNDDGTQAADESDGPLPPSQEPLEPRVSPVGIFHQHTRTEESLLRIRGRSILLLSTGAPDEPGSEIFRFRERPIGFSKRPTLLDMNGNAILNITKRGYLRKFDLRKRDQRDTPVTAHIHVRKVGPGWDIVTTFSNTDDEMPLTFKLSTASGWGRNTVIRLGGVPIARVRRTWEHWALRYYATVAAGVDLALVSAIVTCMEIARPKG